MIDHLKSVLHDLAITPFDLNLRYSAFYIVATILLAYVIWLYRGKPETFLNWLLPKRIIRHRSNLLDIKLLVVNRIMAITGIFGALLFSPGVAYLTLEALSGTSGEAFNGPELTLMRSIVATFIIVVSIDFCKYWSHRLHHQWKLLWPFHAVHHSAEILTPLTLARGHPLETILRNVLISALVGVVQGFVLFAVLGQLSIVTIGGANAFYFAFNALGANLRHSHIWLSYGPVLEHIFISPAQHQVHHSVDVKHHDKNYGSIFAVWDWMFGTLYIPRQQEDLTFGVSDRDGVILDQPHPTLRAALLLPFRQSWRSLKAARSDGVVSLPKKNS